jgi:hypothetical protein
MSSESPFSLAAQESSFTHSATLSLDWENSNDRRMMVRRGSRERQRPSPNDYEQGEHSPTCSRTLARLCLMLDALLGIALTLFASNLPSVVHLLACPTDRRDLVVVLAISLLFRCVLGVGGDFFNLCQRCGLLVSAHSGIWVIALYAALAGVYILDDDEDVRHDWKLAVGAVVIAILAEIARWWLLGRYRRVLMDNDRRELMRVSPELTDNITRRRRPWWWRQNSSRPTMEDPLLLSPIWTTSDSSNNDNVPWWRFWHRRRERDTGNNPRGDNNSVDFMSVQEEWASRDEEDPYWWSRDEDTTCFDKNLNGGTIPWLISNEPSGATKI